jgi:hypothetical protein
MNLNYLKIDERSLKKDENVIKSIKKKGNTIEVKLEIHMNEDSNGEQNKKAKKKKVKKPNNKSTTLKNVIFTNLTTLSSLNINSSSNTRITTTSPMIGTYSTVNTIMNATLNGIKTLTNIVSTVADENFRSITIPPTPSVKINLTSFGSSPKIDTTTSSKSPFTGSTNISSTGVPLIASTVRKPENVRDKE